MQLNGIELTILVKDRPITEYNHQGQTFIEGRAGSEYAIEVRNNSYTRVESVLSVDGLSVIDGKQAGHHSQGYLIEPHSSIRIPGWMLNSLTVAKFAFSGMRDSYAAQSGGDVRNNGVIGVLAFREKPQMTRGIACSASYGLYNMSTSSSGLYKSASASNSLRDATRSASVSPMGRGLSDADYLCSNSVQQQSLGTAFGEAQEFATRSVAFERGNLLATLLCYYDERRGLKARGIKIERRPRRAAVTPQAFPATGCTPPPGWQG